MLENFPQIQQSRVDLILKNISEAMKDQITSRSHNLIPKIHQDCLKVLLYEFNSKTRTIDIKYKYKTGVLHQNAMKYIFET